MYLPKHFEVNDSKLIDEFCNAHDFATLISREGSEIIANHFPVLLETGESSQPVILGHMARNNPQWKSWNLHPQVLCIFHGPHRFISPAWYEKQTEVPTWNYAAVHVTGTARMIEDFEGIERILEKLVHRHESRNGTAWKYEIPMAYRKKLVQGIVGFEVEGLLFQAKFKLNQNRSLSDREGVVRALSALNDDASLEMAALMKTHALK